MRPRAVAAWNRTPASPSCRRASNTGTAARVCRVPNWRSAWRRTEASRSCAAARMASRPAWPASMASSAQMACQRARAGADVSPTKPASNPDSLRRAICSWAVSRTFLDGCARAWTSSTEVAEHG